MTKRVLSLIICLSLLLSMIALPVSATNEPEAPVYVPQEEFEIVGEWIWGETIATLGADVVVDRCAAMGVTDIYLLTKGTGGMLGYLKTQFTDILTREDQDVLQETIDAAHAAGIRVHAWLVSLNDENYKENNPESGLWHFVRERDNAFIAGYHEGYRAFMTAVATELATNYDIDGIHLDYIRYNHLCNGWSEEDFANLEAMGANIENVKYLIRKTFYANQLEEGDEVDDQYIFNAYRNGDPDALLIGQYRRNNVMDFGKAIVEAAKAANPDLIISGALMPEGGYDQAFADLHYGQNYEDAAELYDYIVPMAYSSNYGFGAEWMADIAKNSVEMGNKVVMGTQSYYPMTSAQLAADIEAVRALLPNEDVLGICHFRHSQFSYAKFAYDLNAGTIDFSGINTYDAGGWRWLRVEAAEGVKFTGATLGEGFTADAPIEIAEDGSYIKFGYADDAAEELLATLSEGKLSITFEGAPTDPNARIALARIWINSNESRAYNVYEDNTMFTVTFADYDGTVIAEEKVAYGEAATAPANPVRPGYRFMGWDTAFNNVTKSITTTATYRQIPQTQVVEGFEVVGEWVWGETVAELGADTIVDRCAKNGITDIYMLTKGTGGKLSYLKTQYTDSLTRTNRDVLQEMIDAGHAVGIRVHAWLVTVEDELYKTNHPEAGIWHYVRAQDNNRINPYDEGYNTYMTNVVTEIVSQYEVDGIHLDYIRYNHIANGWSETDFANLEAMGANIDNVKYLINKTLYADRLPEGEEVDPDYIFNALRNGDPDATLIAQYRRNNIVAFATKLRDAAKAANPDVLFTGALMPEGGYTVAPNDVAFADLHYGQNYADAAAIYDYIVPMAYSKTYGQDSSWLAEIAKYSVETGNKVAMGTQSYYPLTSNDLMNDIKAVKDLLPMEGILGIVHFRHSQFSYARTTYDLAKGYMDIDVINTYNGGYKWVMVEVPEGMTIVRGDDVEGFDPDAPVGISADGRTITFGWHEDAEEYVLEALGEGKLHIEFEGKPADPTDLVSVVRIYNINESRAFNVYNNVTQYTVTFADYDGTVIDTQAVKDGEAAVAPANPVRPGYRFMGWDTDFSAVTDNLTVTATYREIPHSQVVEGFEVVGEWVWGETVAELGADTIVERCAKNGITDIYMLTKGTGGKLSYLKTQYTDALTRTNRDVLQEMIDVAHAAGIRVHAWLVTVEDELYKTNHPESGIWHYVRAQDNNRINPYDEGYQTYMTNVVTEIVSQYEVDGIHLDYIRYNHLANGWSETDFANLEAMGANIENVKYLMHKTFYADQLPEGEEVDANYIFNALRNGDPDATLIAQYRRNNIVDFATKLRDAAKAANPDVLFTGALMPEGGYTVAPNDVAFADLHYGQNYEDAAAIYDYIVPMAYSNSYGETSQWLAEIAKYSVEKGNKVAMGLQSYYPLTSTDLMNDIKAVKDLLPMDGVLGIVHFRHSQFSYARTTYDLVNGYMDIDVINTYNGGYKWVIVEVPEGMTITAASLVEGFDPEANVIISEDGRSVKFGYGEEEEGYVLEALGEGKLHIEFTGAPTDPDALVSVARIYITNESRAFNVYNDITTYTKVVFKDAEGNVLSEQEILPGTTPEFPEPPVVEDADFGGWMKVEDPETGNITYIATYNAHPTFTVTFVDYDGTVIAEEAVVVNKAATAPANPVRPGYRFMGWDTDFSAVTEDITVTATYREIAPMEQYGEFKIVGDWVWGSDVAALGADTIIERSAKNGVTDIYLLVKGVGGTLGYNKTQFPENCSRENQDVLQEMIDAGHAVGIRVHAWLVTDQDETYKENNPDSGMWHYKRARDNANITPYDEGYNAYMAAIATEIATNYEIDGIHLDYIRYNHLCNGWSEQDFANLEAMGANVDNVKYLINKTFYADLLPEGEEVDDQYIFNALRSGDADAKLIAEYRRQNVVNLAKTVIDAAKAVNPDLIMSAAFMPEGAMTEGTQDVAFADLHYGQNYSDGAALYDYIIPMAYSATYGYTPEDMAKIAENVVAAGAKVVMGLQSGYPMTSTDLAGDIEAIRQLLPNEGVLGICHFRHSLFSYAKFNYSYNDGSMTVDIINTYASAGYKWVQIDAAEGVKFTAAEFGEGFVADAPIEIAEDGSYVKFGYADDAEDFIIDALAEGTLKLSFEGTPADYKAPVAIARIYITNESRAFNVYNDLSKYITVTFKEDDGAVISSQTIPAGTKIPFPEMEQKIGKDHAGWVKAENAVTGDIVFTAEYTEWTMPFEDVTKEDWFYEDVLYAYNMGLMNGVKETVFAPGVGTTRAMIATILYRMEGSPSVEGMTTPFTDIVEGTWYYDAVVWGYNNGVIEGTSKTTFTPNKDVTREQLATLLYRYSGEEAAEADLSAYPDADTVSTYAKEAVAWAIANGIINGSKQGSTVVLNPRASATRAQVAAILARYCQR